MIQTLDMFCGGGGSSRGAFMAGATPVAALDLWTVAAETYQLNFPSAHVYRAKAESVHPKRIADDVGQIDLILASPECTNHSVAKGNAPRCEASRATAFEVVRYAKVLRPRWIVVENVIQMADWARFQEWMTKIISLGYKTRTLVVNSQDFGTPQSRKRLLVLCDREAEPPIPYRSRAKLRVASEIISVGEPQKAPWAFSPLFSEGRASATIERANRAFRSLGRKKPFILVYYGTDGAGGFQRLDRPLRTITTLDRFALVRPTATGHEMRMLQPPELAAAMGFPRIHKWPNTTRRNKIKLIGNAVCPKVMKAVVESLTKCA